MTILQAIRAAVAAGALRQPFGAGEVAAALREHHFSPGSFPTCLARYSQGPDAPLRRVGPGAYRVRRPRRISLPGAGG